MFYGWQMAVVREYSNFVMGCPHCEQNSLRVRSSKQPHPLLKIIYFQCKDVNCGFTCQANLEIKYQISPPALVNPDINIPSVKVIKPRKKND